MSDTDLTYQERLDAAVAKIEGYDAELQKSLGYTQALQGNIGDVRDDVQVIERAISKIEDFRDEVRSFDDDIGKLKVVLALVGKASALKPFADTGKSMLTQVETFTAKIDAQLKSVVQKIEDSKVTTTLRTVDTELEKVEGAIGRVSGEIAAQKEAFDTVADIAAKMAVVSSDAILVTGDLVTAPLALVEAINDVYDDEDAAQINSIREVIQEFTDATPKGDFDTFLKVEIEMDKVFSRLDGIRKPLNAISDVLKPVEPLLAAADFVASLTVDPIIDFVKNTLGIQKLIDAAADRVLSLLPDDTILDGLGGALDDVVAILDKYDFTQVSAYDFDGDSQNDSDPFGVGDWIFDKLQAELLEAAAEKIGTLNAQGGIAIEIPEGIRGADTDDTLTAALTSGSATVPVSNLVMIGDDKDNVITASLGTNALYGGAGNDTLIGGTGEDTAIFSGPLSQYDFSRSSDTSPVVIEHISPLSGKSLDGRDTLVNIEYVAFLGGEGDENDPISIDALFTQVQRADAGETVDRSTDTSKVFLFASGVSSTVTVLEGGSGDDLLSGTDGNDHLIGNDGNDSLRSQRGTDIMDGGAGIDTFTYQDDGPGGGIAELDMAPEPDFGQPYFSSRQLDITLIDVENVLMRGNRQANMFGDDADNTLASGKRRDILDGRGGNDTLMGGDEIDVLIGGAGIDTLFGEGGADSLVVADVAVLGGHQTYDGGDGFDMVFYNDISDLETNDRSPLDRSDFDDFAVSRAEDQIGSGPIIVRNKTSVERYAADRTTLLATDVLVDIEGITASDGGDILYGGIGDLALESLNGAGGDDVIFAQGATGDVKTGTGADIVHAGLGGANYEGDGFDTLYLTAYGEQVRWLVRDNSSGGSGRLQAFDANDLQDIDASKPFERYNLGNLTGFQTYFGSARDDQFDLSRSLDTTVHAGAGDDLIALHINGETNSTGQTYTVFGEDGDDVIKLGHTGIADGGAGDDEIYVSTPASRTATVTGGEGNDFVFVQSGSGFFDGGEDPDANNSDVDYISANPGNPSGDIHIDLLNGTVKGFGISAQIANFEGAIGSNSDDDHLGGSADGDILIGGGGNDILEGRHGIATDPFFADPFAHDFYEVQTSSSRRLFQGTFPENWTVEAEITYAPNGNAIQRIVTQGDSNTIQFSLFVQAGVLKLEAAMRNSTTFETSQVIVEGGEISAGVAHRVAARHDDTLDTLALFVDGVQTASLDLGALENANSRRFSTDIAGARDWGDPFEGEVSHVRMWTSARTDAELAQPLSAIADIAAETAITVDAVISGETIVDNKYGRASTFVSGASGDDLLYGGSGSDELYGGDGDDLLHGGLGFDLLHGGVGNDTASYAFTAPGAEKAETELSIHMVIGVEVDLELGLAKPPGLSDGARDTLISIENVIGSRVNDTLRGDAGANALNGGEGDDLLEGRGGDDRLIISGDDTALGGEGDDYISLGAGNAVIDGGAGTDTLHTSGHVLYDMSAGTFRSEFFQDVPVWADTGTSETRSGYTPQDVLETDIQFTRSQFPDPAPTDPDLIVTLTPELFQFAGTFTGIEVFDGGLAVDLVATEGDDVLGGLGEDNVFAGLGGNDRLVGNRGNDVFDGGAGDDILDGGSGIDTATYAAATERVAVYLGQGESTVSAALGTDTFISIENLIGSDFNDRLSGDAGDNEIFGGLGDDYITGLAGNDTLHGEGGNDRLVGNGGNDVIKGGDGDDLIQGLGGSDLIEGGAGHDRIEGGNNTDDITGGDGDDTIFAAFGNDVVFGQAGDDDIRGGGRQDYLHGGDGDDRIIGGNGRDQIVGATGSNILTGGGGLGTGDGVRDEFIFFDYGDVPRGFDRIRDFEDTIDKINLRFLDYVDFSDVLGDAAQVGDHVQLDLQGSNLVQIENFELSQLTAGDFIFGV